MKIADTKPMVAKPKISSTGSAKSIQRIFVADDDPFFCHWNAEVLICHGYEVNAVESAEVGWEKLQINQYNLLITENEQPSLTGVGLLKKLRSARMTLPMIMATEQLPRARATRRLRFHPVITLLKPYTIKEFLSAVKIVLAVNLPASQPATPPNQSSPQVIGSWL